MKILFDRYGAQIQAQLSSGNRLTAFFDAITSVDGWSYAIASGALSTDALKGYDVLVLTTRMTQGFTLDELKAMVAHAEGTDGD